MSTSTSKPLKPKRGTTAQNNAYTGEAYEVTLDTDKKTLVCHDGLTAGGFPLAKEEELSSLDTALRALIAEEVEKKLSIAGGTMTGDIIFDTPDGKAFLGYISSEQFRIGVGTLGSAADAGVLFECYTKQHASNPGRLGIQCDNGSQNSYFSFRPNGAFFNEKKVLTEAGGTLSGTLSFGRHSASEVSSIELQPPSGSGHGGYIDFHHGGSTADYTSRIMESYRGHLEINAPNGLGLDGSRVLTGDDIFITGPAGTSFTLPAGGTWKYICVRNSGDTNVAQVGTVAGGTTVAFGHEIPRVLAIRIS